MPFYEYECQACGKHLEAMQKMSEAPLRKCPACGKTRLKRLMSAPVFRLKGGGWYETDFKSGQEAKRNLHGDEAKTDKTETAADKTLKTDTGDKAGKAATGEQPTAAPAAAAPAKGEPKPAAKAEPKPAMKRNTTRAAKRARLAPTTAKRR